MNKFDIVVFDLDGRSFNTFKSETSVEFYVVNF